MPLLDEYRDHRSGVDGDPQDYAAAFPPELGVQTWIDCNGRGWIYVNV